MSMLQKKGIFLGAVFLLGQGFAGASQEDSSDQYELSDSECIVPVISEQRNQANLEDVELYVEELLKNPDLRPSQIGVVLDVDGTLTNYSDPTGHKGDVCARGNAVQFVKNCIERQINIVVSSAWTPFEETIQRLKNIGLGDALKINGNEIQEGKGTLFGKPVAYACLGLVASVKDEEDPGYFRFKAAAYRYVYPELNLKIIRQWIFADDNAFNVALFNSHIFYIYREVQIEKQGVSEGVSVQVFLLSGANGETTLR